jgi:lipopolysaccharide cholinephosphotransferase
MAAYPDDILQRLHETELEILDAIAAVCADEGINWFLIGGTVLGARRHSGFIPWDDDIDTGMLRPDYDRFLEIAPKKLPPEFELLSPMETPGYAPLFAKVCKKGTRFLSQEAVDAGVEMGIFVDIFPRDRVAADPVLRARQYRAARLYTRASYLYHSDHITRVPAGIYGKIARKSFPLVHALLHRFGDEQAIRRGFQKHTALSENAYATETASFTSPSMSPLPISMFAEPELLPFEGRMLPAPNPSSLYLETAYGPTWGELPPPEKRKSHAPVILDFGDGVNVMES